MAGKKMTSKRTKYKIRKEDTVRVIAGKERGKSGKVLSVDRKKDRALVEKLNFVKRHLKPGHPSAPQGGIIEREAPINLSNLMLVCPKCNKAMRPRFKRLETGTRARMCSECGELID
jgi:large subunit ribosomal protein L24